MNSLPEGATDSSTASARHRRIFVLACAAILALLALGLFLVIRSESSGGLVWMTPDQFARASHAGPWTRLKYRVRNLLGPVVRYIRPLRPNILTRATLMVNAESGRDVGPQRPPFATNADGTLAWRLSAAELKSIQQELQTLPGASTHKMGTIINSSGGQAQLSILEPSVPGARYGPVGLRCTTTTKYAAGSVNILLNVTSTEGPSAFTSVPNEPQTNFAVTCRASVPNGGALLFKRPLTGDMAGSAGTNLWFIVSPTAVDARGNPIP